MKNFEENISTKNQSERQTYRQEKFQEQDQSKQYKNDNIQNRLISQDLNPIDQTSNQQFINKENYDQFYRNKNEYETIDNFGENKQNHQASMMTQISNLSKLNWQTLQVIEDPLFQAALDVNPRYIDANVHETLQRLNNYDIHRRKLLQIHEDIEMKRLNGVPADKKYQIIKNEVHKNKLKTFEFQKNKQLQEIKKNNQHLLDKLLQISQGRQTVQQKKSGLRGPSRSLNYVSKKKEAERIDYENQKIMHRIMNVKPQLVKATKLKSEYYQKHVQNKRIILDRNPGDLVEDLIEIKQRLRLHSQDKQNQLPNIDQIQAKIYRVHAQSQYPAKTSISQHRNSNNQNNNGSVDYPLNNKLNYEVSNQYSPKQQISQLQNQQKQNSFLIRNQKRATSFIVPVPKQQNLMESNKKNFEQDNHQIQFNDKSKLPKIDINQQQYIHLQKPLYPLQESSQNEEDKNNQNKQSIDITKQASARQSQDQKSQQKQIQQSSIDRLSMPKIKKDLQKSDSVSSTSKKPPLIGQLQKGHSTINVKQSSVKSSVQLASKKSTNSYTQTVKTSHENSQKSQQKITSQKVLAKGNGELSKKQIDSKQKTQPQRLSDYVLGSEDATREQFFQIPQKMQLTGQTSITNYEENSKEQNYEKMRKSDNTDFTRIQQTNLIIQENNNILDNQDTNSIDVKTREPIYSEVIRKDQQMDSKRESESYGVLQKESNSIAKQNTSSLKQNTSSYKSIKDSVQPRQIDSLLDKKDSFFSQVQQTQSYPKLKKSSSNYSEIENSQDESKVDKESDDQDSDDDDDGEASQTSSSDYNSNFEEDNVKDSKISSSIPSDKISDKKSEGYEDEKFD